MTDQEFERLQGYMRAKRGMKLAREGTPVTKRQAKHGLSPRVERPVMWRTTPYNDGANSVYHHR